MITPASQRARMNGPAIGTSVLSPDQSAWKDPQTRLGREDPQVGQEQRHHVNHDTTTGLTMVSDTDPLPDGWLQEQGGFPVLFGQLPSS